MKHQKSTRFSRKERRKATRIEKKQKMNSTYMARCLKNQKVVTKSLKAASEKRVTHAKATLTKHRMARYAPASSHELVSKFQQLETEADLKKIKQPKDENESEIESEDDKQYSKLKAKKQIPHEMDAVFAHEQRQLRQLEKQLKLNKRKTLPKSFTEDGLDLDACDSDKLKSLKESDSSSEESSDEDFNKSSDEEKGSMSEKSENDEKDLLHNEQNFMNLSKKNRRVHFEDKIDEGSEDDVEDTGSSDAENEENAGNSGAEVAESVEEEMDYSAEEKDGDDEEENDGIHEDIYGRLINKRGDVVTPSQKQQTGAYIPPAKRVTVFDQTSAEAQQVKKQIKGLLNRTSEANMASIAGSVEELYMGHSRALMNEVLFSLVKEAVVSTMMTPERLVAEMALLVAVLHANIGVEVGSYFLQHSSKRFDELQKGESYNKDHSIDNILMLLAYLYNFKVAHAVLMFDIMDSLTEAFGEKDIELILLLLKTSGFSLRRDDPEALGNRITALHNKARALEENSQELPSRVRFMLEVLIAVRNNNIRRVPGADIERTDRLRKVAGVCIRNGGITDNQLKVGLKDLLQADEAGRWWIVGSAWEGRPGQASEAKNNLSGFTTPALMAGAVSQKLVRLGKKLGMNSDIRRSICYTLLSSEDYEDAFQKVLQIGLNEKQQQEIVVVAVTCCKKESSYNPFYSHFLEKLAKLDKKQGRKFMRMIMTHMWDEFKLVKEMGSGARHNLALMMAHLLAVQALPLEVLKKLEFGALEKAMVKFLRTTMIQLLLHSPLQDLLSLFRSVGRKGAFLTMAEGLRVFLKVHITTKTLEGEQKKTLSERLSQVCDELLFSRNLNL